MKRILFIFLIGFSTCFISCNSKSSTDVETNPGSMDTTSNDSPDALRGADGDVQGTTDDQNLQEKNEDKPDEAKENAKEGHHK